MNGFYGAYYTGSAGSGAFGLLLNGGQVFGVDVGGGDISGTYQAHQDGSLALALAFKFAPGTHLVTGQIITQSTTFESNLRIAPETLAGLSQQISLPFGAVKVRLKKIVDL